MNLIKFFSLMAIFAVTLNGQAAPKGNQPTECTTENGFHFTVGYDWSGEAITKTWAPDDYISIELLMKKACDKWPEVVQLEKSSAGHLLYVKCAGDAPTAAELLPVKCI